MPSLRRFMLKLAGEQCFIKYASRCREGFLSPRPVTLGLLEHKSIKMDRAGAAFTVGISPSIKPKQFSCFSEAQS